MIEQRNALLTQADEIVELAEKEVRSLTDNETTEFDGIEKEINELDEKITELEARQLKGKKIENKEEKRMDKNEREIRGLEQYLRRQDGEEKRELQTTADGGAVIPENVANTIIKKMEESSPVFAQAQKFDSVAGSLKIAKETSETSVGFVGEGADVLEGKIGFDEVKLNQKRVGAAISLSNQLINDAAVDIVDYAVDLLARRTAKAVEKSVLTGTKEEEFRGIIHDEEIEKVEVTGAVTNDDLLELYNSIHPEFLNDAGIYHVTRIL